MRLHTLLFALSICTCINAQIKVDNFSEKYSATIHYYDEFEMRSNGLVTIFNKSTGTNIMEVEAVELENYMPNSDGYSSDNVDADLNITGKQNIIISGDFNCDGYEDLAVQTSNYWMHKPSYNIYLYKDGQLAFDDEYTKLVIEDCGMFSYDCKQKTIETQCYVPLESLTKRQYKIEDGHPFLIEEYETYYNSPLTTKKVWTGNEYRETIFLVEDECGDIIYRFKIPELNKELVIATTSQDFILLCLIDPTNIVDTKMSFLNSFGLELSNTKKRYTLKSEDIPNIEIYWTDSSIGMYVVENGKTENYKGIFPEGNTKLEEILKAGDFIGLTIYD